MTFLRGVTTWGALNQRLMDLATGTVADTYGTTASADHRWRYVSPATDIIIPPASTGGFAITQEHRAGYWLRVDDCCMYTDGTTRAATYLRQTSIWTGWHVNFSEMLHVTIYVKTANITPGDYSTAVLDVTANSTATAGTNTNLTARGSSIAVAADGTFTWTYVSGYTITGQVGDPSGMLASNAYFVRHFTSAFRGGIDYWRSYEKQHGGPTYGVAPPGAVDVDYTAVGHGSYVGPLIAAASATYISSPRANATIFPKRGYSAGLGIITNVALTGDRYVVSFTTYDCMVRFTAGTNSISYQHTGMGYGTDGITKRYSVGGVDGNVQWLIPWTGTPLSTSNVQYWMSVTPTHLAVVVNGDTSVTGGQLSANWIAKVKPDDPSDLRGSWMAQRNSAAEAIKSPYRLGQHYLFNRLDALGKGFRDGGRDWQTGSGRMDVWSASSWFFYNDMAWGFLQGTSVTENTGFTVVNAGDVTWPSLPLGLPYATDRTNVAGPDQRWPMGGLTLADGAPANASETNFGRSRQRGYVDEGLLWTPTGNFVSGDELTDTSNGDKYMLFLSTNLMATPFSTLLGYALKEE